MNRTVALALFCLLAVSGCSAGLWPHRVVTAEDFHARAEALEKEGELQQALTALRAASLLEPDNKEISESIRRLERAVVSAAAGHLKSALEHQQAGNIDQARRELLIVLRLSPGHPKALHALEHLLKGTERQIYKVQRGDSFVKIAADYYKDPGKAYILAYFNDMDPGKPLLTDTVLVLPALRPEQLSARRPSEAWVERAQKELDQKQFQTVLSICDKARKESPGHPRIQPLVDAARLGWGRSLLEQNEYAAALEQLRQVSPTVPGRDQALRRARSAVQRQDIQGEIRSAQGHLDRGDFAGAIAICQKVLDQDPSNATAQALVHASRYHWGKQLLDDGHEEKAAEKFRMLDPKYQDVAHLLVRAQARLNARAEEFYRKGVKSFLNEDLESAIESWKKALMFNPEHPKARQDMENASRLMDKWRGLEQAAPAGK
jgi:tetratricopeptide (TPR) repeat protein